MIQLPPLKYPTITRLISKSLISEKDDTVVWVLSQQHPLESEAKIIRMYSFDNNVEIYSVTNDGSSGMRDVIPMGHVKLIQEMMPIDTLSEEMQKSQDSSSEDDDEDEDEDEYEDEEDLVETESPVVSGEPPVTPSNGQAPA